MECVGCHKRIDPEQHRFCPHCGRALSQADELEAETVVTPRPAPSVSPSMAASYVSRLSNSRPGEDAFAPGMEILQRYRIVGLLGRGGMGEVYRADDLVLGQPVALKFLPRELAGDQDRLDRFYNEVRIARTVSHPNVCRVYDIAEFEGRPFLSMELVDGEDLSSLLRRIGRLPKPKCLDLSRQICAGLQAAHKQGVLHRDLKPANIMVDGDGKVRVTDFGLAVLANRSDGHDVRAGTPAYMSPEQLAGRELTIQSDIYSLGLVLYEMFTGHRPFKANSLDELAQMQSSMSLDSPSRIVEEIDEPLERAIIRCLEHDPLDRPKSAMAVVVSLPGGDPMAAAIEAGETPSPEMVAASGGERAYAGGRLWLYFIASLVLLAGAWGMAGQRFLVNHVEPPKPGTVLAHEAGELFRQLGYGEPKDKTFGFVPHDDYLRYVRNQSDSPQRWDHLSRSTPPALLFYYRESPRHMQPLGAAQTWGLTFNDPPMLLPGMLRAEFGPDGRLLNFEAVPPQVDTLVASNVDPGLVDALFRAAGLDAADFVSTTPVWTPPHFAQERRAWLGRLPDQGEELRIEMAFNNQRPIYFALLGPWSRPLLPNDSDHSLGDRILGGIGTLITMLVILGSARLAWRQTRMGRGDQRGAARLALFVFTLFLVVWVISANHSGSLNDEWGMLIPAVGIILFVSMLVWMLYLALEPYVRRHWPDAFISWSRILAGKLRDPRVGRDLLVGATAGIVIVYYDAVLPWISRSFNVGPPTPELFSFEPLMGFHHAFATVLICIVDAILGPLAVMMIFLGLKGLLRKKALATIVMGLLIGLLAGLNGNPEYLTIPLGLLVAAIWMLVLLRYGVLSLMAMVLTYHLLDRFPQTTDFSMWYASVGTLPFLLVLALVTFGFYTASGKESRSN